MKKLSSIVLIILSVIYISYGHEMQLESPELVIDEKELPAGLQQRDTKGYDDNIHYEINWFGNTVDPSLVNFYRFFVKFS